MDTKFRNTEAIVTLLFVIPVVISDMLQPFTHDVRMYQAVARLTEYFGSFPSNLDAAWEIKPIGARFIQYILYKLASLLQPFSTSEYELIVKCLAIVFAVFACMVLARRINKPYSMLILSLAVLTPYNQSLLQPEWFAVLFAFIIIALMDTDDKLSCMLAGMLITWMFLLKGITILLIVPIVLAVWLMSNEDKTLKEFIIYDTRLYFTAFISFTSLSAIVGTGLFPNMFSDMFASAHLARIGFFSYSEMAYNLFCGFFSSYAPLFIPIIFAGFVAFIWLVINTKSYRIPATLACMWLVTLAIVFFQSETVFVYQYFVLAIPAVFTIMYLDKQYVVALAVFMVILFALFGSIFCIYSVEEQKYTATQQQAAANLTNTIPDIVHQDSILYLDIGDAPYYLQQNSSCRYISPLPFKRNSDYWNISDLPAYKENYNCMMTYTGKYIITADLTYAFGNKTIWLKENTSDNKMFFDKLDTEYMQVWNSSWLVYRRIV